MFRAGGWAGLAFRCPPAGSGKRGRLLKTCPMRSTLLAFGLLVIGLVGSAAAQTPSPSAGAPPQVEADPSAPPAAVRELLRWERQPARTSAFDVSSRGGPA